MQQPEREPDEGGLAGAVRPEEPEPRALLHPERHVIDATFRAVALGEVPRIDRQGGHGCRG